MKTRYISALAAGMALLLGTVGCIEDNSDYGAGIDSLPAIRITGAVTDASGQLPVMNFNFGEDCVIDPKISYQGQSPLTYEWYVSSVTDGVRGPQELFSTEPVFTHFFTEGGVYAVQLNVTDGLSGVSQEYTVNINRTFERGLMALANDADGKGNVTFIKDMTAEEIEQGVPDIIIEHSLQRINPEINDDPVIGVYKLVASWPVDYKRLAISTSSHCYFVEPNTFTAVSVIEYAGIIPGFKAQYFYVISGGVRAYDPVMKRYITCDMNNMFGLEKSDMVGRGYDAVMGGSYESWGSTNPLIYYVQFSPLAVWTEYYEYDENYAASYNWNSTQDLSFNGKPLFQGHELVNCFVGEPIPGDWGLLDYPCYLITRDTAADKYYTTRLLNAEAHTSYGKMELAFSKEMSVNGATALPTPLCQMAPSGTYHRTYYSNGNKVYMMQLVSDTFVLPETSQPCLSYGEGEEVTAMYIIDNANELVVATYDNVSQRGSVYVYNVADVRTDNPGAVPVRAYRNCTGRVVKLFYKPSMS